ncbi:MAG: ABC transporter substrate-binding protein [Desulfobacteraceae bacterium]|nr:ABC transporter substrate-binding protein [Desulfobacteraceae bacterium]
MQKKSLSNKKYVIASVIALVIVAGAVCWKFFWQNRESIQMIKEDSEPIHIAMVGPLSGSGSSVGKSFKQGVQLYLDAINEKGGINGRKIFLDEFDDENDSKKAKEMALKLAEQDRAIAVIGHHFSNCSISAGEVYKTYGIPAITPASTNIRVTDENPWYFRACFNDKLQGRFLANYAKKVLRLDKISIVMDTGTYGSYLTEVFEQTALGLGLEIKYKWKIDSRDKDVEEKIKEIVRQIKSKSDIGALFLPVQGNEGIKILVNLKDTPAARDNAGKMLIIAPDGFTTEAFQRGFADFPKERQQSGYYTDGIYVTTPLLFDTTNEKGQKFSEAYLKKYNEKPGWHAAFAYDSAMLIIESVKHSGIRGLKQTLKDDRAKVRDYLSGLNTTTNAVEGVTGYNYFDKHGDSQKPVYMGIYRKLNIVSALIQFQSVTAQDIGPSAKKDEWVLLFDGRDMYRTNVIYTGIEIKEISELDVLNLQCTIDFFIWFRYQGDIDVGKLEFINVSAPIDMGQPVHDKEIDQLRYRLYHVKGKFKADFLPSETAYNQHVLGIAFRHPDLDRNNLIYVKDVLGMGTPNDEVIADRMVASNALNTSSGWKISKVLFFQDVVRQSSKGDPDYLNVQQGTVEFSRFNAGIVINENKFSVRSVIPRDYINYIGIVSFLMLFVILLIGDTQRMKPHFKSIWMFQTAFTLLFLLAVEVIVTDWVAGKKNLYVEPTVIMFNILWWVIPAMLSTRGRGEICVEASGRKNRAGGAECYPQISSSDYLHIGIFRNHCIRIQPEAHQHSGNFRRACHDYRSGASDQHCQYFLRHCHQYRASVQNRGLGQNRQFP